MNKIEVLNKDDIAVLGIPFDENSSFMGGPAEAPAHIRRVMFNGAANSFTELGIDIDNDLSWKDLGDIEFDPEDEAFWQIEPAVAAVLENGNRIICLGGDHSIAYPIIRAHAAIHGPLQILQLDAHPDLYDELDGNRYSHACPFARIMEEGLASRLVQAGIRCLTKHQRDQAKKFGVEIIEMRDWTAGLAALQFEGPIYLSLDIDVLDPAFAPGISHHEPGGASVRQVLDLLHSLKTPLIGADIVEYNPRRDVQDITGAVAAKFLREILGKMYRPR